MDRIARVPLPQSQRTSAGYGECSGPIGRGRGASHRSTGYRPLSGRRFPDAALLPRDVAGEARCLEWLNWRSDTVHSMSLAQIWRPQPFVNDPAPFAAVQAKGHENLREQYAFIEDILYDGRDWAAPEEHSVVDPILLLLWHWGGRIGLDMEAAYPAWTSWAAKLVGRSAVWRAPQQEGLSAEPALARLRSRPIWAADRSEAQSSG